MGPRNRQIILDKLREVASALGVRDLPSQPHPRVRDLPARPGSSAPRSPSCLSPNRQGYFAAICFSTAMWSSPTDPPARFR
jgi:hypothetical protein